MIYPLPEEIPIIKNLLFYFNDEITFPNSKRDEIIHEIKNASLGRQCGLFCLICNDVLALFNSTWSIDVVPIETDFGSNIRNHVDRLRHVIRWLDLYLNKSPDAELYPRLFKESICRIKVEGKIVDVKEKFRLHDWFVICCADEIKYYVKYTIPQGFADIEKIYRFSSEECEEFKNGELNLRILCEKIGAYYE
jgi:hypothetical protein